MNIENFPEFEEQPEEGAAYVKGEGEMFHKLKVDELQEAWEWFAMVFGALSELVELKNIKDAEGKTPGYLERQPKAWYLANECVRLWKISEYGSKPLPHTDSSGVADLLIYTITEGNDNGDPYQVIKEKVMGILKQDNSQEAVNSDFTLWVIVNKWKYDYETHKWFNDYIVEFNNLRVTHYELFNLFKNK